MHLWLQVEDYLELHPWERHREQQHPVMFGFGPADDDNAPFGLMFRGGVGGPDDLLSMLMMNRVRFLPHHPFTGETALFRPLPQNIGPTFLPDIPFRGLAMPCAGRRLSIAIVGLC